MANIITAGNSTNGGTSVTTDTSGTLNIVTGSGSGSNAITIDASQAVTMPGNLTVSGTLTASGGVSGGIRSGTAVTASGTSVDFTSLPTGIKRITVMFNGVSTNGTSNLQIQIGSGSVTTSGYTSGAWTANTNNTGLISSGLILTAINAATVAFYGNVTICLQTGNTWVSSHSFGAPTGNYQSIGGGSIALGGTLDRVRITTVNGTDTFDAGTVNIFYE